MRSRIKSPLVVFACAAAVLAGCTTEPRVTVNTTPAYVAAAPAPVILAAPVITPAPTVVLGAAPAAFNSVDRDFAFNAAVSNMLEIGAARIAPRRTGSADVLSYAAMLDSHHTMALNELSALMRARGVMPPSSLPHNRQGLMDTLGTSRGFDFDRTFINEAGIRAHSDTIMMFQRQMPALSDPDLRAWADRNLPVMRQHLNEAHRIASAIG
jgi:predicted outer membrane protein